MKIAVIGTVGLPANYGGFETLVENLVKNLATKYQFTVYCSSNNRVDKPKKYGTTNLVYIPLKANGVQSIPYDIISIFNAIFITDILLILGVSGCICLPIIKLISQKKIIIHIDGLEWRRAKWGAMAKKFLKISEQIAINYADVVIADNAAIQEYITDEYHKNSELIAYGGDHVFPMKTEQLKNWNYSFSPKSYAIKVCRIEPENNIHIVLEAFSKINNLSLVIVGNWNNSEYGLMLRKKYIHDKNIQFLDPIYDQDKLYILRSNALCYVHGHSAGGTNPSLVEAMFLGLPIIAFDINYNQETTYHKAIYFDSVEKLITLLKGFDKLELSNLGSKMKELALQYYTWENVTDKYADLFVKN